MGDEHAAQIELLPALQAVFDAHIGKAPKTVLSQKFMDFAGAADIDENQSFIFTVARTGGNPVTKTIGTTVTIQGNNSVTITGLPVGSYTVTEDGGWSWRYEATDGSVKTVTLQPPTSPESVTVINENERKKIYWLDGNSWAINNWAATGDNRKKQSPKT